MPPEIQRLADAFLHNPVRVEVARAASTAATITQRLVATGREPFEKRATLRDLIRGAEDLKNAIVFCNRKRDVAVLHRSLERHGFNAAALHGDMDQRARMAALDGFRNEDTTLLVASDVAARGLDIPAVSHVFNYDVPHHAEDYVHRIGRTGRAGRPGAAYTLVAPGDERSLSAIEKLIGQAISWEGPTLAERPAAGEPRTSSRRRVERGESRSRGRNRRGERGGRPEAERNGDAAEANPPRERPRETQREQHPSEREQRQNRNSRERDAAQRDRSSPRRQREPEQDREVIGFGDHVPAFLLSRGGTKRAK